MQSGGIHERTIEDLYDCEIFFLGRPSIHTSFFLSFMADDKSCLALQNLLFDFVVIYDKSYSKNVSNTAGDMKKRMKSGEAMVVNFESDRNDTQEIFHYPRLKNYLMCLSLRNVIEVYLSSILEFFI